MVMNPWYFYNVIVLPSKSLWRPRDKMPCFNWIMYFCNLAMKIQQDIPWGGPEKKLDWKIIFFQNFPLPSCMAFVAKKMLKNILLKLKNYFLPCTRNL